jgi:hypothetical protein
LYGDAALRDFLQRALHLQCKGNHRPWDPAFFVSRKRPVALMFLMSSWRADLPTR